MRYHPLVNQMEMAQCRTARWVTGRSNNMSSVSSMFQSLGWCSLEKRRFDARLMMLYKIRHGLASTQLKDHLKYSIRNQTLVQLPTKTHYFSFSFLPRTVIQWRTLRPDVTDRRTLIVFKDKVQNMKYERLVQ